MRLLLRFSLPMLVGNIFQQFYSMVAAMIVGMPLKQTVRCRRLPLLKHSGARLL